MKYAAWMLAIVLGLYGGIFLMPYKVSDATPFSTSITGVVALIAGFVAGFWLSRPNRRLGCPPLFLVATFFLVSGLLGSSINLAARIDGVPDLALMGTMIGLGLILFRCIKGSKYAP